MHRSNGSKRAIGATTRCRKGNFVVSAICLCSLGGCSAELSDARAHGEALFTAPSPAGPSCETCHDTRVVDTRPFNTGANLAGVVDRPTFWGGQEWDLLGAINHCRHFFMGVEHWAGDEAEAEAMYAFLTNLDSSRTDAVPFTVVEAVADVSGGEPESGRRVYESACGTCHGARDVGAAVAANAPPIPSSVVTMHAAHGAAIQRLVVIEKIRHGAFHGLVGTMPPFSREVLSDEDIASVLEYFDIRVE